MGQTGVRGVVKNLHPTMTAEKGVVAGGKPKVSVEDAGLDKFQVLEFGVP